MAAETALGAVLVHRKTPASGDVGALDTVAAAAVVRDPVRSCLRSSRTD